MKVAVTLAGQNYWENGQEDIDELTRIARLVKDSPHFAEYRFPQEVVKRIDEETDTR